LQQLILSGISERQPAQLSFAQRLRLQAPKYGSDTIMIALKTDDIEILSALLTHFCISLNLVALHNIQPP